MRLQSPVSVFFDFLLDQLAPRLCPCCNRERSGRAPLCEPCSKALQGPTVAAWQPGPDRDAAPVLVRALGRYQPPLSTAIQRLKYERRADVVGALARAWLAAQPEARTVRADYLVPVPLHPRKLVSRGFNQSALFAGELARGVGVPRASRLLSKVVETPSQASLTRAERRTNLEGAFRTNARAAWPGRRLILIDDVVTTGETARACIRALGAARLGVVEIWALSHTPRDSHP